MAAHRLSALPAAPAATALCCAALLWLLHLSPVACQNLTGINLGGWLVLEPWMSRKSPATAAVNYTLAGCGSELCISRYWQTLLTANNTAINYTTHPITQHRNRFVTSALLDKLQSLGVKLLRVPLGFWASEKVKVQPFVPGALKYVDWLMKEAEARGMNVLLDLHAASGAQSWMEHSGLGADGKYYFCGNTTHYKINIDRFVEWTNRYRRSKAFWGIELLNEPGCGTKDLDTFYQQAYKAIRQISNRVAVVVAPLVIGQSGDVNGTNWADNDMRFWARWGQNKTKVALDIHNYHTDWAGNDVNTMTLDDHIRLVDVTVRARFQNYQAYQRNTPLLIGEWSQSGPRFNGTDWMKQMYEFAKLQQDVYSMPGIVGNTMWAAQVDYNNVWGVSW